MEGDSNGIDTNREGGCGGEINTSIGGGIECGGGGAKGGGVGGGGGG